MRSVCIVELYVCYLCTNIGGSTKRKFLSRIYVIGSNKRYSDLYIKFPILLYDFNQIRSFSIDFYRSSQYKILRKFVQWDLPRYMRTDG